MDKYVSIVGRGHFYIPFSALLLWSFGLLGSFWLFLLFWLLLPFQLILVEVLRVWILEEEWFQKIKDQKI